MIRRIFGEVVDVGATHVVVDVGGVGYLVHMNASGATFKIGNNAEFWTYLAVRENALDLYGFQTSDELSVFELLIGLPKIGPKSAAQILAQADISLLREASLKGDATYLSKMSGIGKKSAEKIVQGLKEKFEKLGDVAYQKTAENEVGTTLNIDVMEALISLGYSERDARDAIQKLPEDIKTPSEAIREALRFLH